MSGLGPAVDIFRRFASCLPMVTSTGAAPSATSASLQVAVEHVQRRHLAGSSLTSPRIGVVLGSGLGAFGDSLDDLCKVPFGDIPGMPLASVAGHAGNLCLGRVADASVACMQGRVHAYEGHPLSAVVFGARLLAGLGCEVVLLTNAAGGVGPDLHPGDLMLITDHLNLIGQNPLTGANEDDLGPRFPDMTAAYDPQLRQLARRAASEQGFALHEGVYAAMAGPSYETPAEIRMLRTLGAQAVGMSTVPEVIALRHRGVRVAAVSCITNAAAGVTDQALNHAEVEQVARATRARFVGLLRRWIELSWQALPPRLAGSRTPGGPEEAPQGGP